MRTTVEKLDQNLQTTLSKSSAGQFPYSGSLTTQQKLEQPGVHCPFPSRSFVRCTWLTPRIQTQRVASRSVLGVIITSFTIYIYLSGHSLLMGTEPTGNTETSSSSWVPASWSEITAPLHHSVSKQELLGTQLYPYTAGEKELSPGIPLSALAPQSAHHWQLAPQQM